MDTFAGGKGHIGDMIYGPTEETFTETVRRVGKYATMDFSDTPGLPEACSDRWNEIAPLVSKDNG